MRVREKVYWVRALPSTRTKTWLFPHFGRCNPYHAHRLLRSQDKTSTRKLQRHTYPQNFSICVKWPSASRMVAFCLSSSFSTLFNCSVLALVGSCCCAGAVREVSVSSELLENVRRRLCTVLQARSSGKRGPGCTIHARTQDDQADAVSPRKFLPRNQRFKDGDALGAPREKRPRH